MAIHPSFLDNQSSRQNQPFHFPLISIDSWECVHAHTHRDAMRVEWLRLRVERLEYVRRHHGTVGARKAHLAARHRMITLCLSDFPTFKYFKVFPEPVLVKSSVCSIKRRKKDVLGGNTWVRPNSTLSHQGAYRTTTLVRTASEVLTPPVCHSRLSCTRTEPAFATTWTSL